MNLTTFQVVLYNTPENINSTYYDINQFPSLKEFTDLLKNLFLSKMDDLEHLIQSAKTDFDINAISKLKSIKDKLPPTYISLTTCSYDIIPKKQMLVVP